MQRLSKVELYVDAATYFPVSVNFNLHPDDDALVDIPAEIQFSDYRNVSGSQYPFRVQKFVNNSLLLDLQFQTATLNTGLTATTFTAR